MDLVLLKAALDDANDIYEMQIKAFMPMLEKYKDFDTNPANEELSRIIERINNMHGSYFKIMLDHVLVGAIRILQKEGTTRFRISPMFILPEYQGRGIAQQTLGLLDDMYPTATSWELDTILEEERNCYLYEKMGYKKTGDLKKLNEGTTLVSYLRLLPR
ncbi:GNAT family N-acetyltransferase [Peribacillus sp. SCS-155]|uniref:GNAT family N-acetyltransferase n=1 Tax=Peribacillus sedimenti TaxID=3115297 RepID=UPI003906A74C